jgi:hypothetical protein
MTKWLTLLNFFITALLIVILLRGRTHVPATAVPTDSIRTQHVEIVDSQGRVAASLGYDEKASAPFFVFQDTSGHKVMLMTMSQDGNASMYFFGKNGTPSVSVGYLAGSDVKSLPGEEDPLGSWGLRIRAAEKVKSFDSFYIDPSTQKRIKQAVKPIHIPPSESDQRPK